jgi:cell division protein ZipA
MREWLTVIIALLIIAVVLDGIRRMRHTRRSALRMSRGMQGGRGQKGGDRQGLDDYGSELPNGGARVVNVREAGDARQLNRQIRQIQDEKRRRLGRPQRIPEQVALNLDEQVPTLMEVEQEARQDSTRNARRPVRSGTTATLSEDALSGGRVEPHWHPEAHLEEAESEQVQFEEAISGEAMSEEAMSEEAMFEAASLEAVSQDTNPRETTSQKNLPRKELSRKEMPRTEVPPEDDTADEEEYRQPEDVLIINVVAPKGERFSGKVLLDTVLKQGMRFGSMDIFHHHAQAKGEGGILYSMANMVVPGTFDLASMKEFSTPGVSLFLTLPVEADSGKAFEAMVATAKAIARTLGGELKDENRSILTAQTIEHYRSRIKEFERKQLSRASV